MQRRHELTDAEGARLAPLLPPRKGGKPLQDDRRILNAILWKLATGAPWRDLPERYGRGRRCPPASGAGRGLASRTSSSPPSSGRRTRPGNWTGSSTSSTAPSSERTSTRPGPRGDPAAEALGQSRGGFSTKVHLRADGHGQPLTLVLTPGQAHEAPVFERLLAQGAVRRPGRGRPRVRPKRVAGDKGYRSRSIRRRCRRRGIRLTIPRKATERRTGPFDRAIYRLRHKVENSIARCKQYRSLATRHDKRAASHRALWTIACTMLWIQHAH